MIPYTPRFGGNVSYLRYINALIIDNKYVFNITYYSFVSVASLLKLNANGLLAYYNIHLQSLYDCSMLTID